MKELLGFAAESRIAKWQVAAILGVVLLIGCGLQKEDRMLNERKLIELDVGSVVMLSDLTQETADTVCVLQPYQNKVADSHLESSVINEYLEKIKYQPSESFWSLVFVTSGFANHYTFKRSKELDIFSMQDLKNAMASGQPVNFEKAECASFDRAAIFKTLIDDRIYIVFGSAK